LRSQKLKEENHKLALTILEDQWPKEEDHSALAAHGQRSRVAHCLVDSGSCRAVDPRAAALNTKESSFHHQTSFLLHFKIFVQHTATIPSTIVVCVSHQHHISTSDISKTPSKTPSSTHHHQTHV